MTYLGIDYGEKRIGLAKASDDPAVATPLYTISNDSEVWEYLLKITERENIDAVVIGVPVSFDGQEHESAQKARMFGEELRNKIPIPLYFRNEILSTKEAMHHGPRDVDASAAALILQSFLDQKDK